MKTVYADVLVLMNAALDYLLLLAAGRLGALPLRRLRLGLGALWGGLCALLALVRPELFRSLGVRLLAGALCVCIAYAPHRRFWRALLSFYAASAALAGLIYALSQARGASSGGAAVPVSPRTLLVSFALGYAALSLGFRGAGRRAERRVRQLTLTLGGRSVRLRALEDTGNELLDPVTGRSVLVAEAAALAPLLDDPAPLFEADPLRALEALRAQGLACRLLPCRGVTERRALLLCFLPERAELDGRPVGLVAAVSRNALSPDGGYEAVLPAENK